MPPASLRKDPLDVTAKYQRGGPCAYRTSSTCRTTITAHKPTRHRVIPTANDANPPSRPQPPRRSTLPLSDDPRVRIIRRSVNGGAAAAINDGMSQARGRYLAILADDDMFVPSRLEMGLRGLEAADLALCWTGDLGERNSNSGRVLNGNVADVILNRMTPSMGAVVIVSEKWLPLRLDYRTCEDVEWWLRTAADVKVTTIPEVGYLVRRHDGPRHLSGMEQRRSDCGRLLEDHRSYFEAHPRAHAFRLRRVAHYASLLGDRADAVHTLVESLRLHPSARTFKQLVLAAFPVRPEP